MKKTRLLAAMAGDRKYVTGRPCKRGHTSARDTATGHCIECRNLNQQAYNKRYKKKIKGFLMAKAG